MCMLLCGHACSVAGVPTVYKSKTALPGIRAPCAAMRQQPVMFCDTAHSHAPPQHASLARAATLQEPAAAADAENVCQLHALAPASTALASAACVSEHGHEPNTVRLHACHTGHMQAFLFSTPQQPNQLY